MYFQYKTAKKRKLSYIPEIPRKKVFRFDRDQGQPMQPSTSTSNVFWDLELQKRNRAIHDKYQSTFSAGESSRMWLEFGKDSPENLEGLYGLMVLGSLSSSFEEHGKNRFRAPRTSPAKTFHGHSQLVGRKEIYDHYEDDTDDDSDSSRDFRFKTALNKYMVQKAQLRVNFCGNPNDGLQSGSLDKFGEHLMEEAVGGTAAGNSLSLLNEACDQDMQLMAMRFLNELRIQD